MRGQLRRERQKTEAVTRATARRRAEEAVTRRGATRRSRREAVGVRASPDEDLAENIVFFSIFEAFFNLVRFLKRTFFFIKLLLYLSQTAFWFLSFTFLTFFLNKTSFFNQLDDFCLYLLPYGLEVVYDTSVYCC